MPLHGALQIEFNAEVVPPLNLLPRRALERPASGRLRSSTVAPLPSTATPRWCSCCWTWALVDGSTALHWAAQTGHAEVVQLLLDAGSSVNADTLNSRRALHLAAYKAMPGHGQRCGRR